MFKSSVAQWFVRVLQLICSFWQGSLPLQVAIMLVLELELKAIMLPENNIRCVICVEFVWDLRQPLRPCNETTVFMCVHLPFKPRPQNIWWDAQLIITVQPSPHQPRTFSRHRTSTVQIPKSCIPYWWPSLETCSNLFTLGSLPLPVLTSGVYCSSTVGPSG